MEKNYEIEKMTITNAQITLNEKTRKLKEWSESVKETMEAYENLKEAQEFSGRAIRKADIELLKLPTAACGQYAVDVGCWGQAPDRRRAHGYAYGWEVTQGM